MKIVKNNDCSHFLEISYERGDFRFRSNDIIIVSRCKQHFVHVINLVSREFTGLKKRKKKKKQENSIGALSILDFWEKLKQRMLLLRQAYILLISSIVFTLYCMFSSSLGRESKA